MTADLVAAAASKLGIPEPLVKRSAEARAKATGVPVEDVLRAWAGGESTPAPTATPPAPEAPQPETPEPPVSPQPSPQPTPTQTPASPPTPQPVAAPPTPERVGPDEAADYPVVVTVPTVGLKERTVSAVPRWLKVAFMLIPAFGLLYLAGTVNAGSTCREGGIALAVDRFTGEARNCDGSPFEGRGAAGGGAGQFLALGEQVYTGQGCAACHGANGQGGVGPAFAGVVTTFGKCADHIEWVQLGTAGFQAAGRSTYGDLAKPVGGGGVMPGFGDQLTSEQLASVVAFERIRFGGADPQETLVDCGLIQPQSDQTPAEQPAGSMPQG